MNHEKAVDVEVGDDDVQQITLHPKTRQDYYSKEKKRTYLR